MVLKCDHALHVCKVGHLARSPVSLAFYRAEGGKEGGKEDLQGLWEQSREAAVTHVSSLHT
jgi:hypothetical protein